MRRAFLFFLFLSCSLSAQAKDREAIKRTVREIIHEFRLEETEQSEKQKVLRTIYDDGFYMIGTDDTLKIGGWLQGDVRIFEQGHPGNSRFLIRRARLDLRGNLEYDFAYRFYGEFEGATSGSQNSANLKEGWLEYSHFSFLRMRLGQFKVPFSLEAQYSARWIDTVERAVGVTNLQPAEDLGFMLFGKFGGNRVEYGLGIFNGVATNAAETNDDKDVTGRVVVNLFKDFYLGASGSFGHQNSTLDATGFNTAGGTRFFAYVNPTGGNDVTFNSSRVRAGGDAEWLRGPLSFKGEYIFTHFDNLTFGATVLDQTVHAYAVGASWLLTGENKRRNKPVLPINNFSLKKKGWGAWEAVVRFEQFLTGQGLINAGLATGTDDLWAVTGGLNWWPNKHTLIKLNYVRTEFDDAVANAGGSFNENLVLMRVQFNF